MHSLFPLSPRYRLDDELPWLVGVDPVRRYWINVNGDESQVVTIPGLLTSVTEFKRTVLAFRALLPGETLTLSTYSTPTQIYCIAENCYAIAGEVNGAAIWHLFDQETIESFLMTAHPDWQCSPEDVELGRNHLLRSFEQAAVA
ncbi:hypothetical protein [Egbenema bharatensis]|uniref:hypothetical protein n=1 Tax=Egbenema bharatensis TaxID=3463334 RepID=UPI003A84B3A2